MERETELDAKLSKSTEFLQQFQTGVSMREGEFSADISGLKEQLRACQGENEHISKQFEKLRVSEHNTQQSLTEIQTEFDSHKRRAADIEARHTRESDRKLQEAAALRARVAALEREAAALRAS